MNQPSQTAAVTRDLDLSTPNAIAPSNTGMIFHKAQANTLVHDIKHAPNVNVIGIHAGPREISRGESQSWADVLQGGLPVPAGQAITCVVHNLGQEQRALAIALVVEEEVTVLPATVAIPGAMAGTSGAPHLQPQPAHVVPQKQFGFGADRPAVRTVTNGQAPANTPFVRRTGAGAGPQPQATSGGAGGGLAQGKQTTEVVQNPDGTTRKVVRTALPPIAQRSPEVAAQIRAAGGSVPSRSGHGTNATRRAPTVRASGKAPARVNPPRFHGSAGATARSLMPVQSNGRTRVVRNGSPQFPQNVSPSGMPKSAAAGSQEPGVGNASTRSHLAAPNSQLRTFVVMPADGEFTFALIIGHAERLLLRVESNVALPKMFKPSLTRALATANVEPRTAGGNDVVICVRPEDLTVLRQLIIAGGMPLDVETRERLGRAIRRGLAVVRGEVAESTTNVAALVPVEPVEHVHTQEALAEVEAVIETPAAEASGP